MPVPYDLFNYNSYWQFRKYEDQSERIALERFFQKIGKKDTLADIGGGFGRLVPVYLPFVKKVTLCDPSEKLLEIAKEKFKTNSQISYQKGGFPNLLFPDSCFETVLLIRVIHHLEDPKIAFEEVFRILKPGGFFFLEFANKIHFLARIKAFFKRDFSFASNLSPFEQRSKESIRKRKILFLNHHPKKIISDLRECGFLVEESLSVSNFRNPIIKEIFPLKILLFFEKVCQKPLSSLFFGPSIFLLCYKPHKT